MTKIRLRLTRTCAWQCMYTFTAVSPPPPGAKPGYVPMDERAAPTSVPGDPDDPEKAARLARLARKAESARLARLRHKQFVQDKQNEVSALHREEDMLLQEEASASAAALAAARRELRKALSSEQLQACEIHPCAT